MDLMQMLVDAASNYNHSDMRRSTHAYEAKVTPRNGWSDVMLRMYDADKKRHRNVRSSRFAGMVTGGEFEFRGRLYRHERGQIHCVGMCEETNPQRFTIR